MTAKIYRVESDTHGLWYNVDGSYNGFIVDKMINAQCRDLPMGFDPNMVLGGQAWISAADSMEQMLNWVSREDALQLEAAGFQLNEYEVSEFRVVPGHIVFTRDKVIATRRMDFNVFKGVK